MNNHHAYSAELRWSGSTGDGYRTYGRSHAVDLGAAGALTLSADSAFRGDAALPNPEQLLLAATSSCQLLSFLAVAALAHVDVVSYTDRAQAIMHADASPMRITEITLHVSVVARGTDDRTVRELIAKAHEECYIAHTLATPVTVLPDVEVVS
ncbi:OsmC family protein [Microbacterium sp. LWH7-1.2]|jgi:organic hydroperoxide reductase OsmC/OhrA|uniref:OsmC family protein n=1 Tax=Microbacterium sp. LWH7-1.2 TaxID=3135257 RepID=UPI003138A34A